MMIFKLANSVQNYAWGSQTSLTQMFGIDNPHNKPQAELWMGAHPQGCSRNAETGELLATIIERDKKGMLGEVISEVYGELPYLFKVLAAETPLSIQVHPNKKKSEQGFARENRNRIPLTAAHRNYKDSNHKPELVYALTKFKAMNGFRPVEEIIALFEELMLPSMVNNLEKLRINPNDAGLKVFFSSVMLLSDYEKQLTLSELRKVNLSSITSQMGKIALSYSLDFSKYYPGDIGLLSPFILNIIELEPGEAMFLHAETLHAYVQGTAIEVMASSDNVLRAGLTSKHIDTKELLDNVDFKSTPSDSLKINSDIFGNIESFNIPVQDFNFQNIRNGDIRVDVTSPEILFCVDGWGHITTNDATIFLQKGESCFIPALVSSYSLNVVGLVSRVFV